MEISRSDIRPGDAILWKGGGFVTGFFSFLLGLFFPDWRKRKWKPWHTGFIVRMLEDGEIVTFQAVSNGVHAITYDNVEAMGECKFYHWLDNPDPVKIDKYVLQNEGRPYDFLGYLWTICGSISMVWFNHPHRLSSWMFFCWENLSNFMCFMGKELQPSYEPCLLSKIMNALEAGNSFRSRRLMKSMEKIMPQEHSESRSNTV
jgi:hypothetical protein